MIQENHWQHDEIANRRDVMCNLSDFAMDTSPFARILDTWLARCFFSGLPDSSQWKTINVYLWVNEKNLNHQLTIDWGTCMYINISKSTDINFNPSTQSSTKGGRQPIFPGATFCLTSWLPENSPTKKKQRVFCCAFQKLWASNPLRLLPSMEGRKKLANLKIIWGSWYSWFYDDFRLQGLEFWVKNCPFPPLAAKSLLLGLL